MRRLARATIGAAARRSTAAINPFTSSALGETPCTKLVAPRRLAGCLPFILVVGFVLFLDTPILSAFDLPFNPWAHGWGGRPMLVGSWVGTDLTPSGQHIAIQLDMQWARDERGGISICVNCPRIKGSPRFCAGGMDDTYEIWGGPDEWSRERFHLNTLNENEAQAPLKLGFLRGTWQGDAIEIQTTLEAGNAAQAVDERDMTTPVILRLTRGSEVEYRAACGAKAA